MINKLIPVLYLLAILTDITVQRQVFNQALRMIPEAVNALNLNIK